MAAKNIFISHNYHDKGIVEPIAIRLAEIFGTEDVFYDSWSIQPGEGIIDKMNDGLENCTHFFFFLSQNSLTSNMVKLEWQNAIFRATKGKCKVIPVKLDSSGIPPILEQSLYIDLYTYGIDAAVGQMVNVIQGNSTFSPQNKSFSNLTYKIEENNDSRIVLKIYASHYLEPIAVFLIVVGNEEKELKMEVIGEGMFAGGFKRGLTFGNGQIFNAELVKSPRGITPLIPLSISIEKRGNAPIQFKGLLHQTSETTFSFVPIRQ